MALTGPPFLLFAQRDLSLLWNGLWLAAALLVAALLIVGVGKWRKRFTSEAVTASDQLTIFREMFERGEMSKEEFDKVKTRLGAEIRRVTEVPAKAPPEPPSAQQAAGD